MTTAIRIFLIASILYNVGCAGIPDSSRSQTQPTKATTPGNYPNLKLQATQLSEATLRGDYETAERLTYPKLIEALGGTERFRDSIKEAIEEIESKGVKMKFLLGSVAVPVIKAQGMELAPK
jgi:hypothetical protein